MSVSPLAKLVAESIDPDELGAPVAPQLIQRAAIASGALLGMTLLALLLVSSDDGRWIFWDVPVDACVAVLRALAVPVIVFAVAMLAIDAWLGSGRHVGTWARWACLGQFAAAGFWLLPLGVLFGLAAVTAVAYLALGVLILVAAMLLIAIFLGGG